MRTSRTPRPIVFLLIGPIVTCCAAALSPAQTTQPARSPLVRIVDLDVGESAELRFCGDSKARIKLLEVTEHRDDVARAVRASQVRVEVNGQPVRLICATYHLPVTVAGVQIDCPCTRAYVQDDRENGWGLNKAARLRLWPAGSPLFGPGAFKYPVGQRWFASDTQMANEPVFVDGGDLPAPRRPGYHAGLDFGGVEGMVDVLAATDALVVSAGLEVMPGYKNSPIEPRYDEVYLLDDQGWYYSYCHLHSIDPAIKPGRRVAAGARIGVLGKEGGSGGWSHLHFELICRQPSGQWGTQDAYAYAWETYQREHKPKIIAVARPHQLAWTGQKVTLDGTRSWSVSGRITRYAWRLTDGTRTTGATTETSYPRPGTYSEVLEVADADGNVACDFAVVQVIDKADPKRLPPTIHAAFAPTMGIRVGDPVTFAVRSFRATPAGHEVWDFGDGSPALEVKSDGNAKPLAKDGYATTRHAFEKPGSYIVRVERIGEETGTAIGHLWVTVGK
jgi:murein DD-endopeptidase MepM/ murein hydrolase activator NlpD